MKVTKFGLEVLTGKALSFLFTNVSLVACLALLYLVDLFINKLKTKFNNLFYKMF